MRQKNKISLLIYLDRSMKKEDIIVAPSILAGDFGHLADEAKRIEEAGGDHVHIDIMDGHFVPNLTLGPKAVAAINRSTDLFLDVHIMVYNPYDYVERLVEAGADRITFHFEATEEVEDTLSYIRKCNVEAGLAFCPETSASMVTPYLDKCDLILLMTVNPGFGGQAFIEPVLEKIKFTRQALEQRQIKPLAPKRQKSRELFPIQVDGGVDDKTVKKCLESGANDLVAGTYVFKAPSMKDAIESLRQAL